jgi:hypothetical protein
VLSASRDGLPWDEGRYRRWRRFTFKPAVAAAGLDPDVRVYDLPHHRPSVLINSGANIVEAARQLGHSPTVLLDTESGVEKFGKGDMLRCRVRVVQKRRPLAAASQTHSSRGCDSPTAAPTPRCRAAE